MALIEVKTAALQGAALDYCVAMVEGAKSDRPQDGQVNFGETYYLCGPKQFQHIRYYSPSTDWSQGGPLIERERIDVFSVSNGNGWCAKSDTRVVNGYGPTPLIAAMRCLVAAEFGDTVQVPEELVQ